MTPCKSSRYHPFKRRREVIRTRATISVITRCCSLALMYLKKLLSLSVEMMMIKGRADKVVVVRLFFSDGNPGVCHAEKSTIYPYV